MKNFRKINLIVGWFVFAVAATTYLSTIEPTTSFWDCGERIITAYKMEIGHPPGAPFFMLLGKFFTLFAFGDVSMVPVMINSMSALAAAFTVLFLFWSVTHIAKRVIGGLNQELNVGQTIAVIGSGAIAALSFTFTDTFWFIASEGEVYATSSFFTAIVFWAILKWENEADEKYANRWLILIAYLMGLSIGVHLLNLLVIPAIVFVYYFKKFEISTKGILKAAAVSIAILGFVLYGVIIGYVVIASKFELFFTNTLGMPFKTGFIFYLILSIGAIVYGVYYTYMKQRPIWNTVFTSLLVIIIGYSSFALIIIRADANPPMNQNSPDNVFSFISYLNRDQYGQHPLLHGQYFNAPVTEYKDGKAIYQIKGDKYVVADRRLDRKFDSEYTTFFPRMYSDQESPNHVQGYAMWTGNTESEFYNAQRNPQTGEIVTDRSGEPILDRFSPKRPPNFFENLQYFFAYQINHMYIRYFMWNFVGRQNDIQTHGGIKDGNWISGIKFLDEIRLGNQDKLPDYAKANKARNTYFFLPLILGILGLLYLLNINKIGNKYFWTVLLFFFFTGIAIVLYLNQTPYQPRERDYAYAGSFYAFAIFIGFGVAAIYNFLRTKIPEKTAAIIATVCCLFVPALLAHQNLDDHDRSHRYTARDYARNYLNSCEKNAIIFTNGDNDTFPLWYVQEVEGFRTDVRVINLSYFNTAWYINQMRQQAYESDPIPFSLDTAHYDVGIRDIVYVFENPNLYIQEKYETSKHLLEDEYKALFERFRAIADASNFAEVFPGEAESIAEKGHNSTRPTGFFRLTRRLSDPEFVQEQNLSISIDSMKIMNQEAERFIRKIADFPLPLDVLLKHITSDKEEHKTPLRDGRTVNYLPTTKLALPVDKEKIIELNHVAEKDQDKIIDLLSWDLRKTHIRKNEMMVLDILSTSKWERPVYFATTVGRSHYLNLEPYFQLEGLAYKVVPIRNTSGGEARVNTDILYDRLMNTFVWGGLDENPDKVYLDENNRRFLMNFKSSFRDLAEALIREGKKDSAEQVLDRCTGLFTNEMSPYSYYDILLGSLYYRINRTEKGDSIMDITYHNLMQDIEFFNSLKERHLLRISEDFSRSLSIAQQAIIILEDENQLQKAEDYAKQLLNRLESKHNMQNTMLQMQHSQEQFFLWYSSLPAYKQHIVSVFMQLEDYL